MKKSLFLLLLLLPVAAFSQPALPTMLPNTEISKGLIYEGEPYLAINPLNPQNIVAAWMSFKLIGNPVTIETRYSTDCGATWSDTLSLPHKNAAWQSADVSMAWRSDGVLFISYIDYLSNSNTDGGVFVVSSTDGGKSFSTPVMAIDAAEDTDVSLDRPWIVVDNSSTSTNGYLYIPTKPAPWNPLPNHSYFTRSTDGGLTWSPEAILDSTPYLSTDVPAPMGAPTVASDGTLSIAYPFVSTQNAGFALAQSKDGGQSFSRSFILTPVENQKEKDSIKGGFHIIADPTNPNHLVFAWPDAREGDYDVFAIASFDGGATWSNTNRVNDDPVGHGVVQDMVWPTFGANGSLAIVWRDRRNGSSPGYASASDTYYASSPDGGLTWSNNVRLSDSTAPYDTALFKPGNDFLTGAISNDTLFAAWSEVRNGRLIVNFAKSPMNASAQVDQPESAGSNISLTVVPNPAEGSASISFTLASSAMCSIVMYDDRGSSILQILNEELSSGMHSIHCPIVGLANGDYFIELRTLIGVSRVKLTIKH